MTKYLINFSILTLKSSKMEDANCVTDINPFKYIEEWNEEHKGFAKAKLLSYQDCSEEWMIYVQRENNFKAVKPDHESNQ